MKGNVKSHSHRSKREYCMLQQKNNSTEAMQHDRNIATEAMLEKRHDRSNATKAMSEREHDRSKTKKNQKQFCRNSAKKSRTQAMQEKQHDGNNAPFTMCNYSRTNTNEPFAFLSGQQL